MARPCLKLCFTVLMMSHTCLSGYHGCFIVFRYSWWRAAEEVIYGRDTSRASVNYLADASWLARKIITIWNMKNPMAIHGEPPPWIKRVRFVGPRLDFGGSLYDDYDLTEPPINFNLDDDVAKKTEDSYGHV
ncbi:putative inactive ATP-dependent zinc metalloprotease FTSHI 1, chloroplastic [Datura stramonium]|uniref:Inactive ATP-dependent zinc metalloprotease FTSHI 1, chloroplastic n=1 Tax=Datura stramonium TaxID=4076 RepID=A0ABS8RVR8_DATST|nr:putative inactive ATP-dependent zinc metalloprotease FTSHI 1, chloroplastic [Datura stramonium]